MAVGEDVVAVLAAKFAVMRRVADERTWRVYLGSEAATRGDPMAEITWCSLSLREMARQLAGLGFCCGKDAVARMLREEGYSLQGMSRVLEGRQHPDRDAQFRYINAMITQFRDAGDPVVSVDAKTKEQLGPYHRDGRSWRPAGDPV